MGKWVVPTAGANGGGGPGGNWHDADLAKRLPGLLGWMGEVTDEAGHARQTGTLLLFAEAGMLKACLKDRQEGLMCFITASTLAGILEIADEGLRTGGLDWRVQRDVKPGGRR